MLFVGRGRGCAHLPRHPTNNRRAYKHHDGVHTHAYRQTHTHTTVRTRSHVPRSHTHTYAHMLAEACACNRAGIRKANLLAYGGLLRITSNTVNPLWGFNNVLACQRGDILLTGRNYVCYCMLKLRSKETDDLLCFLYPLYHALRLETV